jgi:hypothetical protein
MMCILRVVTLLKQRVQLRLGNFLPVQSIVKGEISFYGDFETVVGEVVKAVSCKPFCYSESQGLWTSSIVRTRNN